MLPRRSRSPAGSGLPGWPAVAEESIVARDVMLAEHTGSRLHVCHVSTAGTVEVLRWAKARGIDVTAEVTPHHLLLDCDLLDVLRPGVQGQPAAAPVEDIAALRAGLADGTIDAVATDHAPHAPHDKDHAFGDAAFGMLGLQTALGVVAEAMVGTGLLDWAGGRRPDERARRRASAGCPGTAAPIEAGEPANLTLVDPRGSRGRPAAVGLALAQHPVRRAHPAGPGGRHVPARRAHGARRRTGPWAGDRVIRLLLVLACVVALVVALVAMRAGWRNRERRQA